MTNIPGQTSTAKNVLRIILGVFMLYAGISHLTFSRVEFQSQVPDWVPMGKDLVVILSGVVEVAFGIAMIFWAKEKRRIGIALAIFFVLVFPGNIAQYLEHRDAFGLDTDRARFIRLFFQPLLVAWALWSTGAFSKHR